MLKAGLIKANSGLALVFGRLLREGRHSQIMWLPIPLEVAQCQGRETDRHIIGLVT